MKPITYYLENETTIAIADSFGYYLESIPWQDKACLASAIANHIHSALKNNQGLDVSEEANEVRVRAESELSDEQLLALITAFVNVPQQKPLGYWNASTSNPLIKDIAESWGEYLQSVSDVDRFAVIARLAMLYWTKNEERTNLSSETKRLFEQLVETDLETLEAILFHIVN
jgi:hypothetical protein